ncbi:hypothetical protein K8W59_02630 [Nocardioides rotundus]|uniref:asparagine synthase-related protein n=1 Tax=Nocardioides rotundus TaxID=1774216 RepID=UPI001CBCFD4E|nr:asparagine synthase-related protein [Nocardioides rotundus]UAL30440.1 hypothetical protein K8W59_02630 [Nocardioides rotundus]
MRIREASRTLGGDQGRHRELSRQGARLVALWGDGRISLRGSASGFDRVFYSRTSEYVLVSNRADRIADYIGAELDPTGVAIHLIEPVGHPFDLYPLWVDINPVEPGLMLCVGSDLVPKVLPWWSPPEPAVPLTEAAEEVRHAIEQAVLDAGSGNEVVFSDLSGGLDSTSITAISLQLFPASRVIAVTSGDRGRNEDQVWAKLAAGDLTLYRHLLLDGGDLPLVYSGSLGSGAETDHPSPALATQATIQALAEIGSGHGANVHLTGHGGDHLFYGMPTLLRDYLQKNPINAIRKISTYRHMLGWPGAEVLKQLTSRETFATWLRHSTKLPNIPLDRLPILTWGPPISLPMWLSTHGKDLIEGFIVQASTSAQPLAQRHGEHAERDTIRQGAQLARAIAQISEHYGLRIQAPFFDDRVLDAVLSVSIKDRVDPWAYKPLLKEAMKGVLPAAVADRNSKDEGSLDLELGFQENKAHIKELFAHSELANMGLIDRDRLTQVLEMGSHPSLSDSGITTTLCTEVWLRGRKRKNGSR